MSIWVHMWYIYTMQYYSAIKKNAFESVLVKWMKPEPIIQSEVSQKEKHQYSILMHIYGIQTVTMTLYARQRKRHRSKEWTFGLCGRRQGWANMREQHWNMYITICKIDDQCKFDAWSRALKARALEKPRGMWVGKEMGKGFRIGEHMCNPWLIHVSVWQNPS